MEENAVEVDDEEAIDDSSQKVAEFDRPTILQLALAWNKRWSDMEFNNR